MVYRIQYKVRFQPCFLISPVESVELLCVRSALNKIKLNIKEFKQTKQKKINASFGLSWNGKAGGMAFNQANVPDI